jgi:hypothetical protein
MPALVLKTSKSSAEFSIVGVTRVEIVVTLSR